MPCNTILYLIIRFLNNRVTQPCQQIFNNKYFRNNNSKEVYSLFGKEIAIEPATRI